MSDFLALVQANGLVGLITGLVVLLAVFGLSKTQVVITGDQKRLANVILSILLAGVGLVGDQDAQTLVAVIASISSALLYEVIKYFGGKLAAK